MSPLLTLLTLLGLLLADQMLVASSTSMPSAAPASFTPSSAPSSMADPTTTSAGVSRVVIVVGYNGGTPDPRPALSYADDDAARLFLQLAPTATRAWLLTTFDKESARIHPDLIDVARAPTREALAGALGEAFWQLRRDHARGQETELVFAFAGHGDVDDGGRGFVVFADGAFTRDDLTEQVIKASPADINHIIVDACSSYFFVKSRGKGDTDGVPLSPKLLDVLQPSGKGELSAALRAKTGVLVSTSSAREVHESAALSAGVFSYLLRSALTGVADVDGNGRIEYGETAAFLASASLGLDDPRARLSVHAEAPLQRPHSALVDLQTSGATAFLSVNERRPVHLRVLDPRGTPYAEVNATGDAPVYIALVGQPFFLVQRGDEEAVLVPRSAGAYALSALTFHDSPGATARGSASAGPWDKLFAHSFDRGFADGFISSSGLPDPAGGALFAPAWAAAGAPATTIPVGLIGGITMGSAVVVGAGAIGATVMNQVAFSTLEQTFQQTGQLDQAQSLEVESWRTTATSMTVAATALGLVGGGLLLWSLSLPEGEVSLP